MAVLHVSSLYWSSTVLYSYENIWLKCESGIYLFVNKNKKTRIKDCSSGSQV